MIADAIQRLAESVGMLDNSLQLVDSYPLTVFHRKTLSLTTAPLSRPRQLKSHRHKSEVS
jgi:hypothetical protein